MLEEPKPSRCGWRTVRKGETTWREMEEFRRGQNHDRGKTLRSAVKRTHAEGKSGVHGLPLEEWLIFYLNSKFIPTPPLLMTSFLPSNRPLGTGKRSHGPGEQGGAHTHTQFSKVKKKRTEMWAKLPKHMKTATHTHTTCEIYYNSDCFVPA